MQIKPTQEEKENLFELYSDLIKNNIKELQYLNLSESYIFAATLITFGVDKMYGTNYIQEELKERVEGGFSDLVTILNSSFLKFNKNSGPISKEFPKLDPYQQTQLMYTQYIKIKADYLIKEKNMNYVTNTEITENTFFGLASVEDNNRIIPFYPFLENGEYKLLTTLNTIHTLNDIDGKIKIELTLEKV